MKMKRIVGIMLSICLLAGVALAEEMATADEWAAQAVEGEIVVLDAEGRELTRLEYRPEGVSTPVLLVNDYNFDGRDDLAAQTVGGVANEHYDVWLRTEDGGFKKCDAFDSIAGEPVAEPGSKTIYSWERVSAAEYVQERHGWVDGEWTLVWRRNILYVDGGAAVQIRDMVPGQAPSEMTMDAALWEVGDGWLLAVKALLDPENALREPVIYGGIRKVDGEIYHIYTVGWNAKKAEVCLRAGG